MSGLVNEGLFLVYKFYVNWSVYKNEYNFTCKYTLHEMLCIMVRDILMFAKMGNKRVDVINLKLESVFRCCKRRIITSVKILKKAVSLRFVDSLSVNHVEKKQIYQKATIRLII